MELLIGCGHSRDKKLVFRGRSAWEGLTTLDRYAECEPDVVWDLEQIPLPFAPDQFDEIHAYCVLEHCGRQGDWRFFFDQWADFWRIAKPGGTFHGLVPLYSSPWAWGDPSHTRIIGLECLTFLSQQAYRRQVGAGSSMSDFRWYYTADWELLASKVYEGGTLGFVLQAIK
jgi:SAM-dependent methyltransferase